MVDDGGWMVDWESAGWRVERMAPGSGWGMIRAGARIPVLLLGRAAAGDRC